MSDVMVAERPGEKDDGSAACALAARCALKGRFTLAEDTRPREDTITYLAGVLASEYRADGCIRGSFRSARNNLFNEFGDDLVATLSENDQASIWRRFRNNLDVPIIFAFRDGNRISLETCRMLQHSATGISLVRIDTALSTRFTPVDWRAPISIAGLAGDMGDPRDRQEASPSLPPFTVDSPIAEIALRFSPIGTEFAAIDPIWLRRRFRCRLMVIPDNPGQSTGEILMHLFQQEARLDAAAVALTRPFQDRTDFTLRASRFKRALADDMPLQQALAEAFDREIILFADPALSTVRASEPLLAGLHEAISALPDTVLETVRDVPAILTKSGAPLRDGLDLQAAIGKKDIDLSPELLGEIEAFRKRLERLSRATRAERLADQPRFIQRLRGNNDFGFIVGVPATEFIQIGPQSTDTQSVEDAFPENLVSSDPANRTLQIMFFEPSCMDRPQVKDLHLPITGASRRVRFDFVPGSAGPFEARVTVLYRGRILQTALIYAHVYKHVGERPDGDPVTGIAIETRIRPDLEDLGRRRDFQLTLMANRNVDGHRRIVAIANRYAGAVRLDAISEAVDQLNSELSRIAASPARYASGLNSEENRSLLENLALWGAELHAVLRETWMRDSDGSFDPSDSNVRRIQLITVKHDEIIPLEYVYDRPAPQRGARVCPRFAEALGTGTCPSGCAGGANSGAHICPLGFWGLSKTIERHCFDTIDGDYETLDLIVQSVPDSIRDTIRLGPYIVFGHSDRVKPENVRDLLAFLSSRPGQAVQEADGWESWKTHVQATSASLLLAYPHNDGNGVHMTLEIRKDALRTSGLSQDYVVGPSGLPPIVALLGCDTSSSAQRFVRHISQFRRANAGLIVATIATLHANDAPPIGEALVKALFEIVEHEPAYFGDALRIAKRRLLLQSIPAAMSLVAFGDADWKIALTPLGGTRP